MKDTHRRSCCRILAIAVGAWLTLGVTGPAAEAQTLVFEDDFETGNMDLWSSSTVPALPPCNCYFSGDCKASEFCFWGPAGPSTEDVCEFKIPKPNGVLGAGCTDDVAAWGAVCDGVCAPSTDFPASPWSPELASRAVGLWSEAMIRPSAAGGGPLDPALAQEALAMEVASPEDALVLGRHAADLLMLTSHAGFYDHFCHFEHGTQGPSWFVDLGGDVCRQESGRLAIEALQAELRGADGTPYLEMIPSYCYPLGAPGSPPCSYPAAFPAGLSAEGFFSCADERIRALARLLGGPQAAPTED